jgi:chromosome partitioning protein
LPYFDYCQTLCIYFSKEIIQKLANTYNNCLFKLLNTIKIIQSRLNTELLIEGILLTMYDLRLRLSNQVVNEVNSHFKNMVFETIIPRNIRLSESPSYGIPAILHDAESKGAISYLNLAKEIVRKNGLLLEI